MTDEPRNADSWAKPVSTLTVTEMPEGAPNLVDGKRLLSPVQGFGKMWQKTYKVRLEGIETTPQAVIVEGRENGAPARPPGDHHYPPRPRLSAGAVRRIPAEGARGGR